MNLARGFTERHFETDLYVHQMFDERLIETSSGVRLSRLHERSREQRSNEFARLLETRNTTVVLTAK